MKSWLKTASGLKAQQFDIQQQALKLTANRLMFLVNSLSTLKAFFIYLSLPFYLYFIYLVQYVWMPGFFQLKILCKAPCRTYYSTSKMFRYSIAEAALLYIF